MLNKIFIILMTLFTAMIPYSLVDSGTCWNGGSIGSSSGDPAVTLTGVSDVEVKGE